MTGCRLYTWGTPNGFKPLIMFEETGLSFELRPVDIRAGAQRTPKCLAINPNGKIPALVDETTEGGALTLFESGAILEYLADKSGQFLPYEPRPRFAALQWLMFQMSAVGPMFGQYGFFSRAETKITAAIDRYRGESERLIGVLDGHLSKQPWLADDYSIADMAMFPWIRAGGMLGLDVEAAPHLRRWRDTVAARPAVQRALTAFDTVPEH